ncbi:MAG: septum site-determining protein MinC [Anaerolineales bacterium]|nr:MAG: septum site-determining protein MinC [Anaerolineales bacterium]
MSDDRVRIRGTSEGLVITLGAGDLGALLRELGERLSSTASFFRGGRVALYVGPRELTTEELEALGQTISRNGVSLWAVIGDSAATQAAAKALGLETTFGSHATPRPEAASPPRREPLPGRDEGPVLSGVEGQLETEVEDAALRLAQDTDLGVLVRRTLRSGQVVQHPGHVVVIGDVNPGAEIIAGGDVVVWGKLRGIVHAGATGDDGAVVCALSLAPLQLRIGNHIARAPEGREGLPERPEMASVQDGEIVAEPWEK